jgi:hypothetical protein
MAGQAGLISLFARNNFIGQISLKSTGILRILEEGGKKWRIGSGDTCRPC